MFNLLNKKLQNSSQKPDNILKPVEHELSLLEKILVKNLVSGDAELDRMVQYVFKSGGKRLRPAMVFLFAKALGRGYVHPVHYELAEAVEMIHTASILHDDVIDEAETRRGLPTVGKKWGSKSAIIAGDYILSKALTKLVSVGNIAVEMFASTLNELCIGEILQKNQKYRIITKSEYINKSERKTAKLFMAGVECTASVMPGANNLIIKAAGGYAQNYGIAFQITDDIINFTRCGGSDLKDGIITAPVIFAVQEYEKDGDSTLRKLIEKGLKKEKDFKTAFKLVMSSGGIEKTRNLALEYANKAINCLESIEDSPYKQALINLANYTVERNQ